MKRIRIVRDEVEKNGHEKLALCPVVNQRLETGEIIKRGCGWRGLEVFETGWRCFYCGNYIYRTGLNLGVLWMHFKMGREFWRPIYISGMNYINGIPVTGKDLPMRLLADIKEIEPPRWFTFYLIYDEADFKRYVELYT